MSTIIAGLNFASQLTMMAVNPCPPTLSVVMVWSSPAPIRYPARPHSAPLSSIVRMMESVLCVFSRMKPSIAAPRAEQSVATALSGRAILYRVTTHSQNRLFTVQYTVSEAGERYSSGRQTATFR